VVKRWPVLLVGVLAAVMLAVAACGGSNNDNNNGGGTALATPKVTTAAGKETVGVTDTEIKIGTLLPISNTLAAAWGIPISKGMQAYFDYINDQGGIYGRKLTLVVGDSQYTGPVASEAVRRLAEQDQVFGFMGGLGTAAMSATYKYLEENGIPDMFLLAGETMFTDPVARNRFGFLVNYLDEGRILGQYIGSNYDGKKLGILAQNDDFGMEGERGLKLGIQEVGATMETTTQYYDETQGDVTAQMQRLKADGADVIGFYGMPAQAASGIAAARKTLDWGVPIVLTGVDAVEAVAGLAGYDNIEGTVSVVYGHQAFETDNPDIARHHELMAEYAPGVKPDNLTLTGNAVAAAMVHLLIQAGPDLTRDGFLDAAESLCKWTPIVGIAPLSFSPTDHRFNQAEIYVRATGTSAEDFEWKPFGDVISFESTKDCVEPTPPPDATKQPQ
jgi:branched-chain amino acid transport system substrate-binding protein